MVAAAVPWLVARIAVVSGIVLATVSADQLGVAHPPPLVDGPLAWDAHQYRLIAEHGYRAVPYGFRFFPGYPMSARALGTLFGGREDIALVLVANVCALAAGVALYHLVVRETADARTARLSTWLLLAFPAAAPLAMGYAESMGLLAVILAFTFVRGGRWRWAPAPAAVVGLTWSIGAMLSLPLLIEAVRGWRHAPRPERAWRVVTALAPAAGTGAYLAWVQHETGSWYHDVFDVQRSIYHRGLAEPVSRIVRSGRDLLAGHHAQGIQFLWAVLAIGLLVIAFRRLPASYAVWSLAVFLLTISADNIDSFERYLLRAFPLAIAGALSIRDERQEWAVLSLGVGGLVVYTTAIMLGARVP